MRRRAIYFIFGCLTAAWVSVAANAQAGGAGQSAEDLRRELDQLRGQMAAQMRQVSALQARLDEMDRQKTSIVTSPGAPAGVDQQATAPPAVTTQQVGEATTTYQVFAQDPEAAPRIDNAPLDPKFPGFFRLPGTQTFLKIGGYFKTDFIYDLKPAGSSESFIPSSFPTGAPGVNSSIVSIRPTRMNLDFRVPVKALGDVRFYVEADLFGSNSTTPRLRHAYTQAKNFLIGQTFSNFMDPDAGPDGLDFQGPNGYVSVRNPQIRYTFPLSKKTSLSLSVEKPTSDVIFKTPEFSALPNNPSPDGTVKIRHETSGGHVQISALFRDVAAYLPNGNSDSAFGWGLNLAGGQKVFGKDMVVYEVAYGAGIGRYIQDTSGLGIDAAVVSSYERYLRALHEVGTSLGYQHYWGSKVRSSMIYGFAQVNNTAYQTGSTFHKSDYLATNLIWNPFGSLNVGTEFLYGWVINKDDSSRNAPRIMFSAKYDLNFVKRPE